MEKRRVYQVAKENRLSSDALMSMLKDMGSDVKSHMSVVTEEMVTAFTQKLEEEKKTSLEEVQRQKAKEEDRKKTEEASVAKAVPKERDDAKPRREGTRTESRSRDRRVDQTNPVAAIPLPDKTGEGEGRRAKRRGEKDRVEVKPAATGEKPNSTGGDGGGTRGRPKRGKRKRGVDVQAVQENVRKTLSQMNEGRTRRRYDRTRQEEGEEEGEEKKHLLVGEFITVGELAEQMGVRINEVIAACLQLGVMVTINQRLDIDTIATVADEFGFDVSPLEEQEEVASEEDIVDEEVVGDPEPRPPVVTVMGHVDHGKTSLLDYLRRANVVDGEAGGITQHIGAYVVVLEDERKITFLDTPGHAAFTAMRARGARVTDLVILVIAADDNVMPQTIEAIDHSRDAQVPLIVAINKVDLPTADPERIRRELAERDILVEDWGGKVPCVEISATTGHNIDRLLELILFEAELLELKANPQARVRGTIVEAKLDKGRGPVATVLVAEGTMRQGDPFVTGAYSGRVRALLDEHGYRMDEAPPSTPVQVLGLTGMPQAGDTFTVMPSEREAKVVSQRRQQIKREQEYRNIRSVTLSDLHHQIQEGQIKELKVIVKGDVDGSVEAIAQELGGITHKEVRVAVIHSGVGSISESDVLLASASSAVIIGFRVQPDASARDIAQRDNVEIRNYKIIYEIIDDIKAGLTGLLAPTLEERVIGAAQVRQIFPSRAGTIAGCLIQTGKISRNNTVRLLRQGEVIYKGDIASLRRFKDDVREVLEGFECGIGIQGFDEVQEEDIIESIEVIEVARSL